MLRQFHIRPLGKTIAVSWFRPAVDFTVQAVQVPLPLPEFTVAPSIAGAAQVGAVLTASDGTVINGTATGREWLRNGVVIAGATGATYTQVEADFGTLISVRVTATGAGGTSTATSATVGPVMSAAALPVVADNVTHGGNSLVANTTSFGVTAGNRASDVAQTYYEHAPGTATFNIAADGTTTAQVATAFLALSADRYNDPGMTNGHRNTWAGGANEAATGTTIQSDYASVMDLSDSKRVIFADWAGTADRSWQWTGNRESTKTAIGTWGARVYDALPFMMSLRSTDEAQALRGFIPSNVSNDGLHPNDNAMAAMGEKFAQLTLAVSGAGPAFVHDEVVGIVAGASVGTALVTPRILGTANSLSITSQTVADVARIAGSAPYAITQGAGTVPSVNEVVLAGNTTDKGATNSARIVMVRRAPDTGSTHPVLVRGNGQSALRTRILTGATPGRTVSLCFLAKRITTPAAASTVIEQTRTTGPISAWLLCNTNARFSFAPRTSDGTAIGSVNSPIPAAPGDYNFYWFHLDVDAGIMRASINGDAATTATPTAGLDAAFDLIQVILGGNITNFAVAPFGGYEFKFFWMAQGFVDFTDSAVRDAFYNSSTMEGVVSGAGTVSSVTPLVFLRGQAGDYALGKNYGTGGDLQAVPYVSAALLGFEDVSAGGGGGGGGGDVAPSSSGSSITGTPQDGSVLTANATVTGTPTPTLSYQWQRNGTNISGQTASTITLDAAGMGLVDGDTISCEITATNTAGSITVEPTIVYIANALTSLLALVDAAGGYSSVHDFTTATNPGTWTSDDLSANNRDFTQTLAGSQPGISATLGATFDGGDAVDQVIDGGTFTLVMSLTKDDASSDGTFVSDQGGAVIIRYVSANTVTHPATVTVNGAAATTRGDLYTALHTTGEQLVKVASLAMTGDTALRIGGRASGGMIGSIRRIAVLEHGTLGANLADAVTLAEAYVVAS